MPGRVASFGATSCFSLSFDVQIFDLVNVVAKLLDLLLNLDDRSVRDDPERRIQKIAHLGVAIFARLFPERRNEVVVAARQLACPGARVGGVLQDRVDSDHQRLGALVLRVAIARVGNNGSFGGVLLCRIGRSDGTAAGFQPVADRVALGGLPGGTIRDAQKRNNCKTQGRRGPPLHRHGRLRRRQKHRKFRRIDGVYHPVANATHQTKLQSDKLPASRRAYQPAKFLVDAACIVEQQHVRKWRWSSVDRLGSLGAPFAGFPEIRKQAQLLRRRQKRCERQRRRHRNESVRGGLLDVGYDARHLAQNVLGERP